MSVAPGTRLGPYEIVSRIGAGGMGEVWAARDTRLDRRVAVKVLPPDFAHDAQVKLRFEREARAISQLTHPHICTLHDVGQENGISYLVMELLEGESLADRLARGPLPLQEVLRYGAQIADALDKAHRQGVIHRDLKPGNVMLTKSGAKLLDFGLAKTAAPAVSVDGATEHRPLTREGTILGTFQYMAPEQLEGAEADARTDIFALGTLLYEMATAKRAFDGKTKTSLIAAIVSSEPQPISQMQPMTPPAFAHVVAKCLEKDPEQRWQNAHDVAEQLRWIGHAGSQAGVAAPLLARKKSRERLWWATALLLVLGLAAAAMYWRRPQPGPSYRFQIPMTAATYEGGRLLALSPDGQSLLFLASPAGSTRTRLYLRRLDSMDVQAIEGSDDSSNGAFSPDGKTIVFISRSKLQSVSIAGGPAHTIATVPPFSGLTVGNGVVVVGQEEGPILRVSLATSKVEPITRINRAAFELGHVFPAFLPDLKQFLFTTITRNPAQPDLHRLYAASAETGQTTFIGEISSAVQYSAGRLVYCREGTVMAVPFDRRKLKMSGEPATIGSGVYFFQPRGACRMSAAADGTVAWQETILGDRVDLVDREGTHIRTIRDKVDTTPWLEISPDGTSVVMSIEDPKTGTYDLWQYGLLRETAKRLSSNASWESYAVFSPDGSKLYFATDRAGIPDIWVKSLDGSGEREVLKGPREQAPVDVSPDGRLLLYRDSRRGPLDLYLLPLDGGPARPFMVTEANEPFGRFSPDGKLIVFVSNESGRVEIYVKPVAGGMPQQITTMGAAAPQWSADGQSIMFVDQPRKRVLRSLRNGDDWTEPEVLLTRDRPLTAFTALPNGNFVITYFDGVSAEPVNVAVRLAPPR